MDFLGGLLGGVLGIGGSLIGANAASNQASATLEAARDQRNFLTNAFGDAQMNQLALFLGPQQALQMGRGLMGTQGFNDYWGVDATNPNFSDANRARYDQLGGIQQSGGFVQNNRSGVNLPWLNNRSQVNSDASRAARLSQAEAERDRLFTEAGGNVGQTGRVNREGFMGMGEGVIPQYQRFGQQAVTAAEQDLNRIRYQNNNLMQDVNQWGRGEEDRIRRDSARSIADANDATSAEAIASGLGNSSVAMYQRGANRRRGQESANDSLNQLFNQQVDRRTATRQYADSRDIAASEGVRNLAYNVNTQPLDMMANLFSSPTFTPWNNRSTDSLFPDASPSAAFGTNFGNTLAGLGGMALGNSMGSQRAAPAQQQQQPNPFAGTANPAQTQAFLMQFDPNMRAMLAPYTR